MTNQQLLQRVRAARQAQRGVTLVEVLIVVAIMALIAGGVGFMVIPKYREAQIDAATTDAREIRKVVITYMALKSSGECPTVQTLIADRELDAQDGGEDPWGSPYNIICAGDDVAVISPGPDKQEGTEDDIVAGDIAGG